MGWGEINAQQTSDGRNASIAVISFRLRHMRDRRADSSTSAQAIGIWRKLLVTWRKWVKISINLIEQRNKLYSLAASFLFCVLNNCCCYCARINKCATTRDYSILLILFIELWLLCWYFVFFFFFTHLLLLFLLLPENSSKKRAYMYTCVQLNANTPCDHATNAPDMATTRHHTSRHTFMPHATCNKLPKMLGCEHLAFYWLSHSSAIALTYIGLLIHVSKYVVVVMVHAALHMKRTRKKLEVEKLLFSML